MFHKIKYFVSSSVNETRSRRINLKPNCLAEKWTVGNATFVLVSKILKNTRSPLEGTPDSPLVLSHLFVDASRHGMGRVLKQEDEKRCFIHGDTSISNLKDYEKNYTITKLVCLASVDDALDKFYNYLHGQKFNIHTDN